eukprot:Opistho-2@49080
MWGPLLPLRHGPGDWSAAACVCVRACVAGALRLLFLFVLCPIFSCQMDHMGHEFPARILLIHVYSAIALFNGSQLCKFGLYGTLDKVIYVPQVQSPNGLKRPRLAGHVGIGSVLHAHIRSPLPTREERIGLCIQSPPDGRPPRQMCGKLLCILWRGRVCRLRALWMADAGVDVGGPVGDKGENRGPLGIERGVENALAHTDPMRQVRVDPHVRHGIEDVTRRPGIKERALAVRLKDNVNTLLRRHANALVVETGAICKRPRVLSAVAVDKAGAKCARLPNTLSEPRDMCIDGCRGCRIAHCVHLSNETKAVLREQRDKNRRIFVERKKLADGALHTPKAVACDAGKNSVPL